MKEYDNINDENEDEIEVIKEVDVEKDEFNNDFNNEFDVDSNSSLVTYDNNSIGVYSASNMLEHRSELIKEYHEGNLSLSEKLTNQGRNNPGDMVMALVDEMISETDHLLGNELLAGEQDNIRDASIISAKRADVIQMAIKAVQTKQIFDNQHGIDVKSPAMRVVFRFFMKKVKFVFDKLGYEDEASDIFFRTLSDVLENWEKELQAELDDVNSLTVRTKV